MNLERARCERCGKRRYVQFFRITIFRIICLNCEHELIRELYLPLVGGTRAFDNVMANEPNPLISALFEMVYKRKKFILTRRPIFDQEQRAQLKSASGEKYEAIIFGGGLRRFQSTIYRNWPDRTYKANGLPDCLHDVMNKWKEYHPNTVYVSAKLLKSTAGCKRQKLHTDDAEYAQLMMIRRPYKTASYSIIVALEESDNETRVFLENGPIRISPGFALLMRTDCLHAGSDYSTQNVRLFIATGTYKYPNSGEEVNYPPYFDIYNK